MSAITLFIGAAGMLMTGGAFEVESILSVGLGLMWIGLAVINKRQ